MTEETILITFKTICNFVSDLCTEYGKRHKPLKLYDRLISCTQISHDSAIKKHISKFHEFCVKNRDALYTRDKARLVSPKIEYSERVYIDMGFIFSIADKETSEIIWKHLLTISAYVDQTGKAKEILKKMLDENKSPTEVNFITDIISKVEQNVKPDSSPQETIQSLLSSGVFTDLFTGLQTNMKEGKLDLGKMIGTVKTMVDKMSETATTPEAKKNVQMLSTMTGMLGSIGQQGGGMGGGGGQPDMSGMLGMIQGLMGNLMAGGGGMPGTIPTQGETKVSVIPEGDEKGGDKEELD